MNKTHIGRQIMPRSSELIQLSCGQCQIHQHDLVEITVESGKTINVHDVAEFLELCLEQLQLPFSLLINRKNTYEYDDDALMALASMQDIHSMAILVPDPEREKEARTVVKKNDGNFPWPIKFFCDRDLAIDWLRLKLVS